MPLAKTGFAPAVIDALSSHICVIDRSGTIIAVNRAWRNFSVENGGDPATSDIGVNYLHTCRASAGIGGDESNDFAAGVQAVLERRTDLFQIEYPCHSPKEFRWFMGRVTPLHYGEGGAVISHLNITDRKLLELELARLASTDPLTGLPNRRFFMDVAGREVERVRRFGGSTAVLMIDLDHFKSINDTYGHAAGDAVLRSTARACRDKLRDVDVIARFGGEEFVGLLPETDLAGAEIVAEALRSTVSETRVAAGAPGIGTTASFGVAQVQSDDENIEPVLARADGALYAAKASGRNCVRSAVGTPILAEDF